VERLGQGLPNPGSQHNLPIDADPDCDDINFANYKGIYAEDENADQKYTCPVTGAHFEFNDISRRLLKVIEKRKPYEESLYGIPTQLGLHSAEDFAISMLSVSDELVAQAAKVNGGNKNIHVSSKLTLQFKNKFEEPTGHQRLKTETDHLSKSTLDKAKQAAPKQTNFFADVVQAS
jgi:hypothetical protein